MILRQINTKYDQRHAITHEQYIQSSVELNTARYINIVPETFLLMNRYD